MVFYYSESTFCPVRVVILPAHIRKDITKQMRKMSAENIPVLTLKESVGSLSSFSVSVCRLYLGKNQTINSTNRGRATPAKTMKLGVAVQSLKKQIMRPRIPKTQTAIVP